MYTTSYTSKIVADPLRQSNILSHGESRLVNNGLTDLDGAKAIARRLFDTYDRDRNGNIDNVEVVPMIIDAYKAFNRVFSPARPDIDSYMKVLDRNQDNRITYQDIEELCIRYLCPQVQTKIESRTITTSHVVKTVRYTPEVEARLDVARRLFKQFDKQNQGYLYENQISQLISETYRQMGINNYYPSQEEIKSWLQMTDTNNDGRVSLEEYEQLVLRSLIHSGFKVEHNQIKF